ncbi:MAG: CAAX prenyl protease-related protein [Acidobacteria bacterium]|nr:CAAX prenyl protease-related protein [Acidobacteriota bacterium]
MFNKITASPLLVRVLPFALFAALTMLQGRLGPDSQYWVYALKTALGAWCLWVMRPYVREMRWKFSWEAVVVGAGVFALWVGLDGHYPLLAERSSGFNPSAAYGPGSLLALFYIAVRTLGSTLVVPPLEEVFYRSFVYRYLVRPDFLGVPLRHFSVRALAITAVVFGIGHFEWLPGILCALAYQGLVLYKNRLGDAITAHAVTNLLLALWVVTRSQYQFW